MSAEKELFQTFVLPAKKQRYVVLIGTKRGREKIRLSLDHFRDLDPRFCQRVPKDEQHAAQILRTLRNLGAPSLCTIISVDAKLDGCNMDLSDALVEIVGRGQGTFVSCVPGELAYFEGEEPNERYICTRRQ